MPTQSKLTMKRDQVSVRIPMSQTKTLSSFMHERLESELSHASVCRRCWKLFRTGKPQTKSDVEIRFQVATSRLDGHAGLVDGCLMTAHLMELLLIGSSGFMSCSVRSSTWTYYFPAKMLDVSTRFLRRSNPQTLSLATWSDQVALVSEKTMI